MHFGWAGDLARQDQPLEVAAREQPRLDIDRGRADLVGLFSGLANTSAAAGVEPPAAADRRLAVLLHDQVIGDAQAWRAAHMRAVFGHMRHALRRMAVRAGWLADRLAVQRHLPAECAAQPGDHLGQLALAVAGHPGDARRSRPRAPGARHRAAPAGHDRSRRARSATPAPPRRAPAAPSRQRTAPRARPSAAPARPVLVALVGTSAAVTRPRRSTVTRSAIAMHLLELVADKDDRLALGGHVAQRREQLARPPAAPAQRSARPGSARRRRDTAS